MPSRQWKPIDWMDECPGCPDQRNCALEVLTQNEEPDMAEDGDEVQCTGCGAHGTALVGAGEHIYVRWDADVERYGDIGI